MRPCKLMLLLPFFNAKGFSHYADSILYSRFGCGFDAPGNLAHYLCTVTAIHAWPMPGKRHDIGSLDSYEEAKRTFL